MTTTPATPLGPGDYFDAGMRLLARGGVASLTIARLCAEVGATKGSFYHHFAGIEDYRHRLLQHWAAEQEQQVRVVFGTVPSAADRLALLKTFGAALPHDAEAAIRSWSRVDRSASKIRAKVDAARERVVAATYTDAGVDPQIAAVLGRMSVAVLIGAQHRHARADSAQLAEMFAVMHDLVMDQLAAPVSTSGADRASAGRRSSGSSRG